MQLFFTQSDICRASWLMTGIISCYLFLQHQHVGETCFMLRGDESDQSWARLNKGSHLPASMATVTFSPVSQALLCSRCTCCLRDSPPWYDVIFFVNMWSAQLWMDLNLLSPPLLLENCHGPKEAWGWFQEVSKWNAPCNIISYHNRSLLCCKLCLL